MIKSEMRLTAKDGKSILVHCWQPHEISDNPIIIQIVHGMAEHGGKYEEFANFLVQKGFIVYANDHRGHGLSTGEEKIQGYFADTDGWNRIVDDLYMIGRYIKDKHPKGRLIILGHSMGSFLARRFVQCYDVKLAGLIISGTGWNNGVLGDLGIGIAKFQMLTKGSKYPSTLLDRLSFGKFNKFFESTETPFDWLSRDKQKVNEYIDDSNCGFIFTAGGFYDMLGGIKELHKKEELKRTPKDIPIYIFSGELDPVGKKGKAVKKVYNDYISIGCSNVSLKLYPEARHEMLNEINRHEVYEDIIDWINSNIS